MKLANLEGRAVLVTGPNRGVDVHTASQGTFGPDPADLYPVWEQFAAWAAAAPNAEEVEFTPEQLGPPSPAPRQILGIGLNYHDHADESGFEAPENLPPVFPKFLSSLTGPVTQVELPPEGHTDWEVELVAVVGQRAERVEESRAWEVLAGVTAGQDLSERVSQLSGPAPQFGLGKSFPGFAPTGPWLVTPEDLPDRDDLRLTCALDGEVVQDGQTAKLIASVPRLVAGITAVITLHPGDLIFTGTPAGVGLGRKPQRWISAGQTLVSTVEGIGELRQTFIESTRS